LIEKMRKWLFCHSAYSPPDDSQGSITRAIWIYYKGSVEALTKL
jgi:hypothetical protein